MDPLELEYDNIDAVPEKFRDFYSATDDGKAIFNVGAINGMKTQSDVNNVQEALRKERNDHKAAVEALKPWATLGKVDEVQASLARIPELEAAAAGKLDDEQINVMVEGRLKQRTAPLTNQITSLTTERDEAVTEVQQLKGQILARDRNDAVGAVAAKMKVLPEAMSDVKLIVGQYLERDETSNTFIVKADAQGVTPGASVEQLMKEMQKARPYWWPPSEGGGGRGGGSVIGGQANPWHKDHWNMTEQGKIVREHGGAIADQMAKAAGTTVGGLKPV